MSLGLSRHPDRMSFQVQVWISSLFRTYMLFRAMEKTEVSWKVIIDREMKRSEGRTLKDGW